MNPAYAVRQLAQTLSVALNSDPDPPRRIYTKSDRGGWGRDWFIKDNKITGWLAPLPRKGDEFHVAMTSGKTGRYVVTKVCYCTDPPDMFFADVEMEGYAE